MKLLVCRSCGYVDALKRYDRRCTCGESGGRYNEDGDTATVWGDKVFLLGLNNRWVLHCARGGTIDATAGANVMWPYPMDNGKITHLAVAP